MGFFNFFKKRKKASHNPVSEIEKFSDKWLFQEHSPQQIRSWAQQLKYFYFIRAWGGMNNDGDRFEAKFSYESKNDLVMLMKVLGITLNVLPPDTPQPVPGVPYPAEEFDNFKRVIRRFPDFEQPGSININLIPCYIYIDDNSVGIIVSGNEDGNAYTVKNEDFKLCRSLEAFFDSVELAYRKNLTIENNAGCVSPRKYPQLFE